jgi:hypothetical protein
MFWKGKDQPAVTMSVEGGGAPVTATPAVTVSAAEGGRQEAVLNTTLPLRNLSSGRYHLVIDARLPNGQTAGRVVLFEVK